jgi:peptide/nickel transport system ATP-binding protein
MLLRVHNLCIDSFHQNKQVPICKNLTFDLKTGENLGILGESGSGKSISVLSILRLLPPSLSITGGNIFFTSNEGIETDLVKLPPKAFQSIRGKEIAMVFQEPMSSLNPVFTCGDQVLETIVRHHPGLPTHEAREQVFGLFKKVKLEEPVRIFNSYPHQLSGGQKQRVMIAMAISCNPRILIADEPTTALDVTVQKSILDLLKELQSELGMSILFITHDISVISEIAQRILVFYKGEMVEQGDAEQILTQPVHPYTKGLLACRSAIHKKGERLMTIEDSIIQNTEIRTNLKEPELLPSKESRKTNSPPPEPKVLLDVQHMDVAFHSPGGIFSRNHKKQVLHKISFSVFQGETLGLVGESGSGKTTIGRTIMKLLEADKGNIMFHGKLITHLERKELQDFRKKVQIIFQDPYSSLNPKITIGEMIAEPLIVHHLCNTAEERKKRVFELLRQVNLSEEHYNRYPHQFSGGQRQRIGIARALAVEPELLILDESVSALDVSVQAQVLNLLNHLKETLKLTFIFISHDLNTVHYMADRMIVLKDGRIMEEGVPDNIFTSPKSEYTARLIEAIPGMNYQKP